MNCKKCGKYYYGANHKYKSPCCKEIDTQRKNTILQNHPKAKKTKCNECEEPIYYPGEGIRHHTCYFPELVMIVCHSCHQKSHSEGVIR